MSRQLYTAAALPLAYSLRETGWAQSQSERGDEKFLPLPLIELRSPFCSLSFY